MLGWAWTAAGLVLAGSLLLPWFRGTDDGRPLSVPGWDTEPGFTLGVLACATGIAVAGRRRRPLVALACAVAAAGLIAWMLPRGDRYSGYDLGPGGLVAVAAVVLVAVSAGALPARLAGRDRHGST